MKYKHGVYWVIKDGQDISGVWTDYGVPEKDDTHTVPLATIEAPDEFDKTDVRFEGVRWFEPKK